MSQIQVEIILSPPHSKSFMVYRELVCFHSEYFRRAFGGSFRESEEKSIEIEDVDERTFRLFQFWLYAQATREEVGPVTKKPGNQGRTSSRSDCKAPDSWQVPQGMIPEGISRHRSLSKQTYLSMMNGNTITYSWIYSSLQINTTFLNSGGTS